MRTADFDYHLPKELIAQKPLENRHDSRLLVYNRQKDDIKHVKFLSLKNFLDPGDLLVVNNTKVIPARIYAKKETGGSVELLLLSKIYENEWEVLVGGKRIKTGSKLSLNDEVRGVVVKESGGSKRSVRFNKPIEKYLCELGQMPLPPYIHEQLNNLERYQTIYAQKSGSAAAPTAGLHFSEYAVHKLKLSDIHIAEITLHVGLDTFLPVTEENVNDHLIHSEWCEINPATAQKFNRTRDAGKRIIAVGTTSARTLETAYKDLKMRPFKGETNLFIVPGYKFQAVDALLTNFHLPKSTLLMMVSAFADRENILKCYQEAIKMNYRFYSFGDAMLIL